VPYSPTEDVFLTLACGLVVALYASRRYNTPETNRFSTTRALFLFTGAGYVAASLALFFVLSEIVLKPGILTFLGLEDAQKYVAKFSAPPVIAAVLLTTLLPNAVVVSTADAWLLGRFQTWGRIPLGIRILADSLAPASLTIREADLTKLRVWIMKDGDVPDELAPRISTENAETPSDSLTRILRLYCELQKLQEGSSYANSFRRWDADWQSLRADFRIFAAQSHAFFVLFDTLATLHGTAGEEALEQSRDRYREICRHFHAEIAEFLARLLLNVEGSRPRILERLRSIGFWMEEPCPPLPVGPLVFMGAMMIVAILGVVATVPPGSHRLPLPIIAVLIGTTQTIGLVSAVLPKLRWSTFRPDSRGNHPYLGWLASSSFAGIVAFLIDRTATGIAHHTFEAGLDFDHYPLSPMGPMAFAISLSIAIICDVDLGLREGWVRRMTEGLLCGVVMVASIFICTQLLDITPATKGQAPSWFPFAFSCSLGFASGFIVPAIYRQARRESAFINPPADGPKLNPPTGLASAV
jgi:hypothetical protein